MMTHAAGYSKNRLEVSQKNGPDPGSGRVLIVEDEEDLASLLEYNLKKAGYQIYFADNGRKALQLAEEILPDVILLDILLPEMSGWDVCRTIREHKREDIATTPIIMLTALRDTEDKYRGLELGADAFINKPYAVQEVLLHCRNFAGNRQRQLDLIRKQHAAPGVQKDDLYKLLVHELRTQLTVIGGLTNLLGRKHSPGKQDNCIHIIQKSIAYLEDIIKEIKTLDKISQQDGISSRSSISLEGLIGEILALVSPIADRKNISLLPCSRYTGFHFGQCKTAVRIMLVTILENAVKYSPENSAISIRSEFRDEMLRIAISDNGPGIEPGDQVNIFQKSYRTESARKYHEGTGLGLYIAKKLADSIQATITVRSEKGRGSIFTCSFPMQCRGQIN